jgi:hypothetical protein
MSQSGTIGAGKSAWLLAALALVFVACAIDSRKLHVTAGAGAGSAGMDSTTTGGSSSGGSESTASGTGGSAAGAAGTGAALKLPAETCQADSECGSSHCVDGVCCDSACDGACVACNSTTSPGHCAPVPSNSPSPSAHPACDKAATATCGQDGLCDGAGACRKYESGTPCAGGSCDATSYKSVTGAACDGKGSCVPAAPVACTPFKCNGAACATVCQADSDCVGQPCVNGSCGTVANGNVCKMDAQCSSGHCADGFCCNSACTDSCEACDLANHQGTCTPLTAAAKPHGTRAACATGACSSSCDGTNTTCSFSVGAACGTCHACTSNGACQPVGDGTADAACPAASASCAAGGCNASGSCKAAAPGTLCANYTCSNTCSGLGQYTAVDHHKETCDGGLGAASCKAATNEGCGRLVCANGTACKSTCSADIDCTNGNYCNSGSCSPWQANGGPCSTNSQCSSRICEGGQCVECAQQQDCPTGNSCDPATFTCVCNGCTTTCTYPGECSSSRAPGCSPDGSCDCFGTPPCPAGTICYRANTAGTGQCLAPVGMPCKADGDCAGMANAGQMACVGGVCAPNPNNCARIDDCSSGQVCCNGFGSGTPSCTDSCSL